VKTGGAKKDIASMDLRSEDIASVDFMEGAKSGIASVDFIAVAAARFGSKLAGLTLGE
jgi:hypothetical protein